MLFRFLIRVHHFLLFRTNFILDFIACAPADVVVLASGNKGKHLLPKNYGFHLVSFLCVVIL